MICVRANLHFLCRYSSLSARWKAKNHFRTYLKSLYILQTYVIYKSCIFRRLSPWNIQGPRLTVDYIAQTSQPPAVTAIYAIVKSKITVKVFSGVNDMETFVAIRRFLKSLYG
jgi:hypothetical protein